MKQPKTLGHCSPFIECTSPSPRGEVVASGDLEGGVHAPRRHLIGQDGGEAVEDSDSGRAGGLACRKGFRV
jgi:hypothetical protein